MVPPRKVITDKSPFRASTPLIVKRNRFEEISINVIAPEEQKDESSHRQSFKILQEFSSLEFNQQISETQAPVPKTPNKIMKNGTTIEIPENH